MHTKLKMIASDAGFDLTAEQISKEDLHRYLPEFARLIILRSFVIGRENSDSFWITHATLEDLVQDYMGIKNNDRTPR
jgi:hypothetical protein